MARNESNIVSYDDLDTANLVVDRVYEGKTVDGRSRDPMSQLFKVGVQGGIRFKGSAARNNLTLVVLYSTGDDPDWRDQLDVETGTLTYYGDNKKPGSELLKTHLSGNLAFKHAFELSRGAQVDREQVPPFFYFERVQKAGSRVRFRGLAVPGGDTLAPGQDLEEDWWSKDHLRFQNYRARFTILDAPVIEHAWIDSILTGTGTLNRHCPEAWRKWVESRTYTPLLAPSTDVIRKSPQLPDDALGIAILETLRNHFKDAEKFSEFARAVWNMLSVGSELGSPSEAIGGQALRGTHLTGPEGDPIGIRFVIAGLPGVDGRPITDVGRSLFSKLQHREFGVFVTLSWFDDGVYRDVRSDTHSIALICGRDVVETLRRSGLGDVTSVSEWLSSNFPVDAGSQKSWHSASA